MKTNMNTNNPSDSQNNLMQKYTYLTEVTGEKALEFSRAQNKISDQRLKSDPRYRSTYNEAYKIVSSQDKLPGIILKNDDIYNFWQDDVNVKGLIRRTTVESFNTGHPTWITVLDIDLLAKTENKNWVYKGMICLQPAEELCLIQLSDGGKDALTAREFNLKKMSFVDNGFVIPESKSHASWLDENTLIVGDATNLTTLTNSGYPSLLKILKRGEGLENAKLITDVPKSFVSVSGYSFVSNHKRYTLVNRNEGFYESETYLLNESDLTLKRVAIPKSAYITDVHKGQFLVFYRKTEGSIAEGSLVSIPENEITHENHSHQIVFKQSSTEFYSSSTMSRDHIYIEVLKDVKSRLIEFSYHNKKWIKRDVQLADANGNQYVVATDETSAQVYFGYTDFLTPTTFYHYDTSHPQLKPKKVMQSPAFFDSSNFHVEQFYAKSKDGTKVPYFMVSNIKTKLNGQNPTLLYAYGGFENPVLPTYLTVMGKEWLEKGGVYVSANIRGGGEFGPDWHKSVLLEKRHKIYEDFYAVAEDLIHRKVTDTKHLGIKGGSNGGLLTSVALTQRPELFAAVISEVPLTNMLEYHHWLSGASWMAEYGNPDDPALHDYLASYSPVHNIKKDVVYPEPFYLTSTKDDRVHPGHARQMVARLQDMGHPVLYNENIDGGHGRATNAKDWAEFLALEFTYLYQKLF